VEIYGEDTTGLRPRVADLAEPPKSVRRGPVLPLGCGAGLLISARPGNRTGTPTNHFSGRKLSRRLLTPIVAGSFCLGARDCPGFI
jgi:hypothetical protein